MKYCNIIDNGEICLCCEIDGILYNLTRSGYMQTMEDILCGKAVNSVPEADRSTLIPAAENPKYANIVSNPVNLVCVGLNYRAHAAGVKLDTIKDNPILFSKFYNALAASGDTVFLPSWESTYDYEAELVIVMGKTAWNVSKEDAMDYVFGYTAGNDFSCRAAQKRSSQWLIGKTLPGFGPCGPYIVTKDEIDPDKGISIKSFVNGELRQDGNTEDMIFSCAEIVSYASRYIRLEPGDLIFTGTPAGVQLECGQDAMWLKTGDVIDVVIEGIGTLTNTMG